MTTGDALRNVGRRALGWLEVNLSHFRIDGTEDDLSLVQKIKPIAELALTCDLLSRAPQGRELHRDHRSLARGLLRQCWEWLGRGDVVRRLLITYPDLFSLVTVYPPFLRAGLRSARLERSISALAADRSYEGLEFPPWRQLDFAIALRACRVSSPWDPLAVADETWLGHQVDPWMISDSAAYSVTHTVFYLCDFGHSPEALPVRFHRYLVRWSPVWCRYYTRNENLDLLCEMLMVAFYVGTDPVDSAVQHVYQRQDSSGFVPGPHAVARVLASEKNRPSSYDFLTHYHTTLVAVMASLAGLRSEAVRPRRKPRRRPSITRAPSPPAPRSR